MKFVALPAGLAAVLLLAGLVFAPAALAAPPVIQPSKAVPAEKIAPAGRTAPPAAPETPPDRGSVTGLPIPRFVSLRTDEVNMRVGPGMRYPIEWVYKWRGLPVKVLREFQVWRLVEAPDGTKGWMHQATIVGGRTFLVIGKTRTLREAPRDDAGAVAELRVGVIGKLKSCKAGSAWCRVQVGERSGWLRRSQIWGVLPDEVVH
ncbi:MAG: hypothetical protein KGL12_12585 [Rhodospirillales bacterium]|nr:hypothetical protein [Rhodospirillales bacterium]